VASSVSARQLNIGIEETHNSYSNSRLIIMYAVSAILLNLPCSTAVTAMVAVAIVFRLSKNASKLDK